MSYKLQANKIKFVTAVFESLSIITSENITHWAFTKNSSEEEVLIGFSEPF